MKTYLTIFFCFFFFVQGIAQDDDFEVNISSSKSLKEIKKQLAYQFNDGLDKKLYFAVDVDGDDSDHTKAQLVWFKNVKKHGQYLGFPRNYVAKLDENEANDIRFIVTFLANNNIFKIAAHRSELEIVGDRIDHVHPLNFLGYVFSDEELKVCFRNVRAKGWVWGDFIDGLKECLTTEASIDNMKDSFVKHFSDKVSCECQPVYPYISPAVENRNWDELIHILLTRIPRNGDHDRHDD